LSTPHFSDFVIAGELVLLSGQMAVDTGQYSVCGDIAAQTLRCLELIEGKLARLGLARDSIIKTTVWLAESRDFGSFNQTYAQFFGDLKPARSTVRADLMLQGALVEIEAWAVNTTGKVLSASA
jgi:2-iminobutanoate/2-iminopropanoate deaminase